MSQGFDGPTGARQMRPARRSRVTGRMTVFCVVALLAVMLVGQQTARAQGPFQRFLARRSGSDDLHRHVAKSPGDASQPPRGLASQAATTTATDYVHGNLRQAGNNTIGLTLQAANPGLGRVWNGYRAVQAANQVVNSGTPGSPIKAARAVAAADLAVGGVLTQAGVGPQAVFITGFADNANRFTMNKQEEGTAVLREGTAQLQLDAYRQTGDPQALARSAVAAKPDVKCRDLEAWNGRGVLQTNSAPAANKPLNANTVTIQALSDSWSTSVKKQPLKTNATTPAGRATDWVQWKLNPHNIQVRSNLDRTVVGNDGTTRVQIEQRQTGYGYQPGETKRFESVRTEFHGNRTEAWQPTRSEWKNAGTQRQSPSWPSQSRANHTMPNMSRPSFDRPSFPR